MPAGGTVLGVPDDGVPVDDADGSAVVGPPGEEGPEEHPASTSRAATTAASHRLFLAPGDASKIPADSTARADIAGPLDL